MLWGDAKLRCWGLRTPVRMMLNSDAGIAHPKLGCCGAAGDAKLGCRGSRTPKLGCCGAAGDAKLGCRGSRTPKLGCCGAAGDAAKLGCRGSRTPPTQMLLRG
ncbi:hypothetical protein NL676_020106 [Syzygium grande]|nr:hypothetical protein NL676_020106 [Syzygium grande]